MSSPEAASSGAAGSLNRGLGSVEDPLGLKYAGTRRSRSWHYGRFGYQEAEYCDWILRMLGATVECCERRFAENLF